MQKQIAIFVVVHLFGLLLIDTLALAANCREFGTPSYSAIRVTVLDDKNKFQEKIFVSGNLNRIELETKKGLDVKIFTPSNIYQYNTVSKKGFKFSARKQDVLNKPDKVEKRATKEGVEIIEFITASDGKSIPVFRLICDKSGIPILTEIYAPGKDNQVKKILYLLRNVKIGIQDKDLFKIPDEIKLEK